MQKHVEKIAYMQNRTRETDPPTFFKPVLVLGLFWVARDLRKKLHFYYSRYLERPGRPKKYEHVGRRKNMFSTRQVV